MHQSSYPLPVFLTGATGFIGRRLTQALLDLGYTVSALVLPRDASALPEEVRVYPGDVTDSGVLSDAVADAKPVIVFHLAAIGMTNPFLPMIEACRVNVDGVINILDAVHSAGCVQRVVLVGSSYEYGARRSDDELDPFNPYSASKVAAWAFARAAYNASGIPIVWVRPFQVFGPGQHAKALVPAAILAAIHQEDFPMTRGEQQRDFIFVNDVVEGLLAAGRVPDIEGRVLDLGSGKLHSVRQVVERIWVLSDAGGQVLAGALPYRPGEVPAIPANVQRTRMLTGWEASTPLDEGLILTIDALRNGNVARCERAEDCETTRLLEGDYVE
jgi:UDP-glucose 4-epimerase